MKYLVLIQARCGSTRYPNKVLANLAGKTDIEWVIERVRRSHLIDEVMVVTSIEKNNLPLIERCVHSGVRVFVGSEDDVLDRYYQAARLLRPEYVIRITADCPMIDWRYLDMAIEQIHENTDYLGEITETFPDGLDIEIIKFTVLKEAWEEARLLSEREHVTMFIKNHPERYCIQDLVCPIDHIGNKRWTLDEDRDYEMITKVYDHFVCDLGKPNFVTEDILEFLATHPEIEALNVGIMRNEGLMKSLAYDKIVDDIQ